MHLAKSAVHPFLEEEKIRQEVQSAPHTHRLGTCSLVMKGKEIKLEGTRILHNFGVKGGPGTKI